MYGKNTKWAQVDVLGKNSNTDRYRISRNSSDPAFDESSLAGLVRQ